MKIYGPRHQLLPLEPKSKALPTTSQAGPRFTFESVDQRRTHLMGLVETAPTLMGALTENPLKVGVVGFSAQGGSGNIARMMAGGLQRAGHDVTYMTAKDGFWSTHAETGVRVRDLDMPTAPTAPTPEVDERIATGLVEAVKAQDLDVVWVHYAAGLLGGALKAKEQLALEGRPLKVAVTLHGTDVSAWGHSEYRSVLREQLLKADTVTAVSNWLADEARTTFEINTPDVVPNSISVDTFQPNRWSVPHDAVGAGADIRRRMVANGEVLISHASNLRAVKRPIDLVEAFAKIRSRMPAKLMLMGETDPAKNSLVGKLYERAVELGVAQDIIPVGVLGPEELARHYAGSTRVEGPRSTGHRHPLRRPPRSDARRSSQSQRVVSLAGRRGRHRRDGREGRSLAVDQRRLQRRPTRGAVGAVRSVYRSGANGRVPRCAR